MVKPTPQYFSKSSLGCVFMNLGPVFPSQETTHYVHVANPSDSNVNVCFKLFNIYTGADYCQTSKMEHFAKIVNGF